MRKKLSTKLILTISVVYLLSIFIYGWYLSNYQIAEILKNSHYQSEIYTKSIALSVKPYISKHNISEIEHSLSEFINLKGVHKISVTNMKNVIQAELFKNNQGEAENSFNYGDVYSDENETIDDEYTSVYKYKVSEAAEDKGWILVEMNYLHLKELKSSIWLTVLVSGLVIFIFSIFILISRLNIILSPLAKLHDFTRNITHDLGDELELSSGTLEIDNLIESINWASVTLKKQGDQLKDSTILLEQQVVQRTAELLAAKEHAELASDEKSQFLSRMSHELRTPLNSILGFSQILLLKPGTMTGNQIDEITEINKSGDHLLSLVNEILDISNIENGELPLVVVSIDVVTFFNNFYHSILGLADTRKISVSLDNRVTKGCFAKADEQRLTQVMYNLVSNAIKYNVPEGTISIVIDVDNGNMLLVKVIDSGIGINDSDHNMVFEKFTRFKNTHHVEGAGIGLHLTKELVELMGGEIGFNSQLNQGSTFWFKLPLEKIS